MGWFERRKAKDAANGAGTRVCPACRSIGPAQLYGDQVCATCETQRAWLQAGDRLVIDRAAIDEAVQRRQGAAPTWTARTLPLFAPSLSLALAALAVIGLARLLAARPLGPLTALLEGWTADARFATLIGAAGLVLGAVALVRLRRHRWFRRLGVLACHLLAIVAGATAVVLGGFHWLGLARGFAMTYATMPARVALADSAQVERIVNATVVVLAPDADGDARSLAVGTGAIVAADDAHAWIATCSHVALPGAAVGGLRDARTAQPVWIQLSDGREGAARVRWLAPPPLDVALVELAIAHPPAPVAIATSSTALAVSDTVMFVPNPYRDGWKILRGQLLRRERHHTPADRDAIDLLYTDLPVIPGDSGSGLYDARGELVGLNTWSERSAASPRGISLPAEAMRAIVDVMRTGQLGQLEAAPPAGVAAAR